MSLNRSVATILTVASILFCGLPGLALFGYGSFVLLGSLTPRTAAEQLAAPGDLLPAAIMLACVGWFFMAVPVAVSWLAIAVNSMTRTAAIVFTVLTVLFCGLPGLAMLGTAALAAAVPELRDKMYSPEEIWMGIGVYIFGGLVLLFVPLIVGIVSFKRSKPKAPATEIIDVPHTS
jgi:hypothetical protein